MKALKYIIYFISALVLFFSGIMVCQIGLEYFIIINGAENWSQFLLVVANENKWVLAIMLLVSGMNSALTPFYILYGRKKEE